LLESRKLRAPDGRPLYGYIVSGDEYRAVGADIQKQLVRDGALHRPTAAAFCLYGAEYFGRGDGSDWWTYEGVTRVLGLELPQQDLRDAIAAGLAFWRRRVIISSRGEYLTTLVCEGGLPLALLQTEGGRLRRYFSELLRQHETYPTLDLKALAIELAGALPIRMQNEVVYTLACALIRHVAVLRHPAGSAGDVAAWPAPLRLDSELAQELLNGLRNAPRARAASEPGIVVRTTLDLAHQPVLRRQLVLPRRVSRAWLVEVMPGLPELPPRWYVALVTAGGTRWTVGVATSHAEGYELRTLAAREVIRPDTVTQQLQCVVSFDERDYGGFVPRGGEALPDLPWTFGDMDDDAVLRATGSYRSRAASLLLALARGTRLELDDGATAEPLGELLGLDRGLVRLRGSARVIQPDDTVTIATGQVAADERTFELRGLRASPPMHNVDLWLGRPHVVERDDQGVVRAIPQGALQWRRRGGSWSSDPAQALGDCELRASHDGHELRTRARILPSDFTLRLQCGHDRRGTIEVRTAKVAAAGVAPSDGFLATTTAVRGGFDIGIGPASAATPPGTLELTLKLTNGAELSVTTPLPVEQVIFTGRGGQPLLRNELCSVDDLSHLRALAMSPHRARWAVALRAGPVRLTLATLPDLGGGLHQMSIEPLRPTIIAALAADAFLDNEVELRLEREGHVGGPAPSLRIRRYGAALAPETKDAVHDIVLEAEAVPRLGDAVVESLQVRAVPLAEPDRTPVILPRVARGRWNLDLGLQPGLWLVMAYQNDYLRTRPLRVTIPGNAPAPGDDPISRAIEVKHPGQRAIALDQAVAGLGNDTTGPGWAIVRRLVSTVGSYPSGTFDLVRAVTRCPRVAVLTLLDSCLRADAIWAGLEDLPFLWVTVPVGDWLQAIQAWIGLLRSHLSHVPGVGVERTAAAAAPLLFGPGKPSSFLACIHDAAYLRVPGVPEPSDRSVFFARDAAVRAWAASLGDPQAPTPLGDERNKLLIRHIEDHWPGGSPFPDTDLGPELSALETACTAGVPSHKSDVLATPIILAQRSVDGAVSCDLLRLRQLRDFDPDWFDFALALSLSILLGARYQRKEPPFHE
jgi:hypothetical protein